MFPNHIQHIISNYLIFDLIPLDKFLHFIFGLIYTLIIRRFGVNFKNTFLSLIVIAIVKEIIDSKTLNSQIPESILDILITLVYPIVIFVILKIKQKT